MTTIYNIKVYFIRLQAQLKYYYRGSSLSTIFGILKKSYYVKFVLVGMYYIANFH